MSRFLVIGSNSFSGASFSDHLLKNSHEVLGISRSKEINNVFLPYQWNNFAKDSFQFHQVDLNKDLEQLIKIIIDYQPEYIVNFAAQGMVAQSWDTPEDWYQTNVVAQVKLHNELRKLSFLTKYVHVSTPEAYGSTDGWVTEHYNFSPSTPYAVSRASCDLHLLSFFKAYNFPVVFTRAANVYGPGQQLYRIVPRALLFARMNKRLFLHGGGHSVRSFIHIDDVASATLKIAIDGEPGQTYHISTKDTVSIRKLVEIICEMTNIKFSDLAEETEDRLGKDQSYLLDSSFLRTKFLWRDEITLQDGIQNTLAWVDKNIETLKSLPMDYEHKQ
jgi:dTDP-glucose 4,6-dehydratase